MQIYQDISHIHFKFSWLLNSFDLPSYRSEMRKRYKQRLFLTCLRGRKSFESCSTCESGWGKMTCLMKGFCLGRLGGWIKLCVTAEILRNSCPCIAIQLNVVWIGWIILFFSYFFYQNYSLKLENLGNFSTKIHVVQTL